MSQFDPLIISSLVFSLFFTLYFYYLYHIQTVIPFFLEVKKFRNKKFSVFNYYKSIVNLSYYYSIDFKYLSMVSFIKS